LKTISRVEQIFRCMKNVLLITLLLLTACYHPRFAHRELNDARNHIRHDAYNKAIRRLTGTIRRNPSLDTAYYLLGLSYFRIDSIHLAITNLDRALTLNPKYIEALIIRAQTIGGLEGLQDLDKALAIDSTNAWAYYQRAKYNNTIGNPYGALDDLAQAERYGYSARLISSARYVARAALLDFEGALNEVNTLLETDSLEPQFVFAKYVCYAKLGLPDLAERCYRKALSLGMDSIPHERVEQMSMPFLPFTPAEIKELEETTLKKNM
jgi:tetratricopeptide (TPR) repeat protein